jgi:dimethylhistidine N-methyltransferase
MSSAEQIETVLYPAPTQLIAPPSNGSADAFARDVVRGLSQTPKTIPSKYFYDARGSRLFQQITELDEYYLTRCEFKILQADALRIASLIARGPCRLIELGVGDGRKTSLLLREWLSAGIDLIYAPIDICGAMLSRMACDLRRALPELSDRIQPVAAEYLDGLAQVDHPDDRRNIVLFLGSSIGNFDPHEAQQFLRGVRRTLAPGDAMVIGFDLKKEIGLLVRAYNDARGVTREFNFNLLDRLNRELGGNFVRERFVHHANYNEAAGCMESWLVSDLPQRVRLAAVDRQFAFDAWEGMQVERSYKYTLADIETLAETAGFSVAGHFLDSRRYFADSVWTAEESCSFAQLRLASQPAASALPLI